MTGKISWSGARALIPFGIFVFFYAGLSVCAHDFYRVPMIVAFLVAGASALVLDFRRPFAAKAECFASGMGNSDIMTMVLIFILAGAFAQVAQAAGAVDSAVRIAMTVVPSRLMLSGIFLAACFVSLAIGTSCGTIATLTPIAVGVADRLGIDRTLMLGVIVGGAMFGDNLSMISDTTIAATRTQKVGMHEKFFANLRIAVPAALLTLIVYWCYPVSGAGPEVELELSDAFKVLPYFLVMVLALMRVDVMAVLFFGIAGAGMAGYFTGAMDGWGFLDSSGKGTLLMSETLIVALLAGGLLAVVRAGGGVDFLLALIERGVRGRRGGELGIALLTAVVNVFTANNTVAIVIAGPVAHDIARKNHIPGNRSASILDSSSCVVQGLLPYGAQVLIAVGLTGGTVSAAGLIGKLYYPIFMALTLLLSIFSVSRRIGVGAKKLRRNFSRRSRVKY